MNTIFQYEIELTTRHKTTGVTETKIVTEYAYSVTESAMQAVINHSDNGTFDVGVKKIGPPARAVELVAHEMSKSIDTLMKRLIDGGTIPPLREK